MYNYLLLLFSAVVFLRAALRSPHLQRRQATILLIGTLCPRVALLIYLTGLSPLPNLDLTPLGYSLGGLVLAWELFRYHRFDIVPVVQPASPSPVSVAELSHILMLCRAMLPPVLPRPTCLF